MMTIGCLCIHGFTGNPNEIKPLVNYLNEKTNWLLAVPTLPGHGETLSLKGIRYEEWLEHAEAELKVLLNKCETVYVIGFSMGGLIASYLATHYPVKKLVLLSAAARYINLKQLAADIAEMIRDSFRGNLAHNDLFLRYKTKIRNTPIEATRQFRTLVSTIRPMLANITIPTFIAQGEIDGIVPPKTARYLYDVINAQEKKLIFLKECKHLICHCNERDKLFAEVLAFLKRQQISL
ncbi:alpha/beta fold hydrolase [Bacillus aquiflavi]|uniref:Alpha/beta fold hydrolase n=2 Tax=Bacillus aquiflavi TaxID=2672567 RepID=A0A6B3VSG7_9BACI|nr:alpha/beta fold hydrolase [Bacillus aquiflavi]MBA4536843.1 alpha/beta fold hydrolase [Bacillus aquiflavi]NEY81210.1 alpha/beta fold hydrolase [Bacillus aquiflavi]UAC49904.1 alpha/beta fold hydrolase [Bacillus aquiflavi]